MDRTGEGLAVARQREDCLRLVKSRGWDVVRIYEDNDASASSGKPRPCYNDMLIDVRDHKIDVVVAWASDRLHRRLGELVEFVKVVSTAGVAVATVNSGDVDLSTPHGRMLAGILGSVAQAEVEQKGLRQQRANQQRATAGSPRFSRRPYGYSSDGRSLIQSEAAVIREYAQSVLAGASLRDSVAQLNARGEQTSTGAAWTVSTLRRVMLNPRIAGLNSYRGELLGRGEWPAIVTEDVYQALVGYLKDPRRRLASTNVRKYLLSGLLRCGVCGEAMYASECRSPTNRWMGYRCRIAHNSRRMDLVDTLIESLVLGRLSRTDAADLLVAPDRSTPDGIDLGAQAVALRSRLEEAASLFANGSITPSQLQTITREVRDRLVAIEAQQADVGRVHSLAGLVGQPDVARRWTELSLARKRAVIDSLLTATIHPVGKGKRFSPDQVQVAWK